MCMRTEVFGVKKNPSEFEALMYFCMSAFIKLLLLLSLLLLSLLLLSYCRVI